MEELRGIKTKKVRVTEVDMSHRKIKKDEVEKKKY